MISTPATIHISTQTPAILPAGLQVSAHNIGIDYCINFQLLFRRMVRRNSVVGTATCYGLYVLGFEPRWVRDFPRTFTLNLWPPQPPIKRVTGFFFPEVKQLWRGVDHPPTSDAEVKERVELHLYSPSVPSWLVER
jgi:hypothetical protein